MTLAEPNGRAHRLRMPAVNIISDGEQMERDDAHALWNRKTAEWWYQAAVAGAAEYERGSRACAAVWRELHVCYNTYQAGLSACPDLHLRTFIQEEPTRSTLGTLVA
jgi:hypothetical protein